MGKALSKLPRRESVESVETEINDVSLPTSTRYYGDLKHQIKNGLGSLSEIDRVNLQHFLLKELNGFNFKSPVNLNNPQVSVLDVGCGAGTWVLDLASENPANFYGIDILPLFPTEIKPPNASFSIANLVDGLPFEDNSFDFVHMRLLVFCLSESDWEIAIQEIVRVCKPNGWIEIFEADVTFANALKDKTEFNKAKSILTEKYSINLCPSPLIRSLLETNDSLNIIHFEENKHKLGSWGGKLGKLNLENYKWGMKNFATSLDSLGFTEQNFFKFIEELTQEIEETKDETLVAQTAYRCNPENQEFLRNEIQNRETKVLIESLKVRGFSFPIVNINVQLVNSKPEVLPVKYSDVSVLYLK
ncbi:19088_t:CDS:2 [Funneliformis geosporum]|uniref:6333_t:CDS:1 n=1 Tax=Funneliformis geosporum TaxID=1117311 RepID=A0A9W4X3Q4_9GLOM|nr:19088_t:CDS:2 [Funneliformis geosporum]CAI2184274.1 6333_t:CDS:2 [Funneliformis geosporum]